MSALMCSTPWLPQLVTMLVASAMLAAETNGEGSSPGTTGTPVCQVIFRSPFWWSPNEVVHPICSLENNGTRGSSDTGAISSGGGERSICGSHTAPGAGSLGFRNSPLARATGSPCCSTRVSTRQRRLPSRTIRLVSTHGCFRAGRKRSSE